MNRRPPKSTLFPNTTLSRSAQQIAAPELRDGQRRAEDDRGPEADAQSAAHHPRLTRAKVLRGERRHRRDDPHRSEEHTSELQSPCNLVCRLLLEKKKYSAHRAVACRAARRRGRRSGCRSRRSPQCRRSKPRPSNSHSVRRRSTTARTPTTPPPSL